MPRLPILSLLVLAVFAGCTAEPAAPGAPSPGLPATPVFQAPTFGASVALGSPAGWGIAGEPSLAVAPDGTYYVAAPLIPATSLAGDPGQGRVWRSTDHGASFKLLNDAQGRLSKSGGGDGDTDIAVGADGTVHFVDLAGGIPYLRSTDRGDHWSEPQTLSTDNQTVDRQWVDAWGPDFVVASWAVSGRQAREISFVASHDGGASWSEPRTLTKKMLQLGPIVIAADGQHVYQPYVTPSPFVLHVLVSADRGGNWTDVNTKRTMTIPDDAPMVNNDWSPTFVFPAIAADHHNVYVVWSEYRADKTTHLVLLRSSDAGKSWMEPLLLDESRPNSVLPWIAVGDDGHVAITSLQSDTAMDPNKGLHHWMLHALVTPNAMDASPSWSDGLVTPDIVQTGAICPEGGGCLTRVLPVYGDRTLLDFMEDAIGPDGSLSVTWTQPNQTHDPEIRFAHQTSGSPLRAPLAPRASS